MPTKTEIQERLKKKFGDKAARTGGKGSARRKVKAKRKTASQDDKRLQSQLKKLNTNNIPAIEEVNLFKSDGSVVHFSNPKVQASIGANTYVVSGQASNKKLEELIPQILPQLGPDHLHNLKDLAESFKHLVPGGAAAGADGVPDLVPTHNFEELANRAAAAQAAQGDAAGAGDDSEDSDDEPPPLIDAGGAATTEVEPAVPAAAAEAPPAEDADNDSDGPPPLISSDGAGAGAAAAGQDAPPAADAAQ